MHPEIKSEEFLLLNSDTIFNFNLEKLYKDKIKNKIDFCLLSVIPESDFGCILLKGSKAIGFKRDIRIEKNRDNASEYEISGHYTIWVSKDFRINDKPPLTSGNISLKITSSDLNSNIYTLLYNELKTKYTSTTDEL